MTMLTEYVQNIAEEIGAGLLENPEYEEYNLDINHFRVFRRHFIGTIKESSVNENLAEMISQAIAFSSPDNPTNSDTVENLIYNEAKMWVVLHFDPEPMTRRGVAEVIRRKAWSMIQKSNIPTLEKGITLNLFRYFLLDQLVYAAISYLLQRHMLLDEYVDYEF